MSAPPRVVHVCAYFAPAFVYGGPPRSLLGLCRAQRAAGLDVRVVTTTANGTTDLPDHAGGWTEYDGIPVRYCRRAWPRSLFRALSLGPAVAEALAHADVLHLHGLWNAAIWSGAAAARRTHTPYVLSPRGMLEPAALAHDGWRKRIAYVAQDRRVIEGASVLHATSAVEQETLSRRFRVPAVCVPNGVDLVESGPATERAPVVLFLGRIHPLKRLDLLAGAFVRMHRRFPAAKLVIAGPDEAGHRARVEPLFAAVADAVSWTGEVDDPQKQRLLQSATALVLCSDSESFGMSAAEAMAAGCPVVVTRTVPWRGVEREGAGYVVDQTADAIAAALERIFEDPGRSRAMGEQGQRLVAREYSWPVVATAMARVYEDVLARAGGA